MTDTYRLRYYYQIEQGRFTRDQVAPGQGAADALLVCSVLFLETGDVSFKWVSRDGTQPGIAELPLAQRFLAWGSLANELARDPAVPAPLRAIAEEAVQKLADAIREPRT